MGAEGRDRPARQGLLRQARPRQGDVPRAADDPVLPRGVGRAPSRGDAAAEHDRRRPSCACCGANGKWAPRICATTPASRTATAFTRAMDELQAAMLVIPSEVVYGRSSPTSGRSPSGGSPTRCAGASVAATALREIARCFLAGAGMTVPGELARVTGLVAARKPAAAIARSSPKAARRWWRPERID